MWVASWVELRGVHGIVGFAGGWVIIILGPLGVLLFNFGGVYLHVK